MRKTDIKMDYRGWKFRDNVPLIPRDQQWKGYFDAKFDGIDIDVDIDTDGITNTISDKIDQSFADFDATLNENLDGKFCSVHQHIEEAKDHLCCDICCAKNDIKNHINTKLGEFDEEFSNLNEQAERIIQKLDEI